MAICLKAKNGEKSHEFGCAVYLLEAGSSGAYIRVVSGWDQYPFKLPYNSRYQFQ